MLSLSWFLVLTILGVPGVVSWVRNNGDDSFQERAREPLGCHSLEKTSSTTYSNVCRGLGTKIMLGQHLSRCFRIFLYEGVYSSLLTCVLLVHLYYVFSVIFYNINKIAFTVITVIKTLQY